MDRILPFRIDEFNGARPHQVAHYDKKGMPVGFGVDNRSGIGVTHVRGGLALTPKGALLLRQFMERPS